MTNKTLLQGRPNRAIGKTPELPVDQLESVEDKVYQIHRRFTMVAVGELASIRNCLILFIYCLSALPRGLEIGVTIPPFALADQTGQTQTLDSIKGPGGAMIVFYRSADW
jgi:hypothetical protein